MFPSKTQTRMAPLIRSRVSALGTWTWRSARRVLGRRSQIARPCRRGYSCLLGSVVSIGEIMNDFNISQNGSTVAGLSTVSLYSSEKNTVPKKNWDGSLWGASTSSISVMNSTDTEGTINITIANTPLEVPSDSHPFFSQFSEWCPSKSQRKKKNTDASQIRN